MSNTERYKTVISFHKRWSNPPTNETEWKACFNDMLHTFRNSDQSAFMHDMLMCVYAEIERQYKADQDKKEADTIPA